MLRLSKKIDYGLLAMTYIAFHDNESRVINTKEIAEEYSIPGELLAKVLQRLAKKGLILSQNGPKGGYQLAKEPGNISVGEIVKAIEGPIQMMECNQEDHQCLQIEKCSVRSPLTKIQQSISNLLDNITLEEMRCDDIIHLTFHGEGVK
ncbi:MAG TPA: Rrf2 family transcriptional regulator [Nitrospiria bacterium]|jgi:Rrf2 family protein